MCRGGGGGILHEDLKRSISVSLISSITVNGYLQGKQPYHSAFLFSWGGGGGGEGVNS